MVRVSVCKDNQAKLTLQCEVIGTKCDCGYTRAISLIIYKCGMGIS